MNSSLLKRIGDAPGVSGFENSVQELIAQELMACCDDVWRDHMGTVFALKRAKGWQKSNGHRPLRMMLTAHADEIGFMVKHINANGYVHFIPVGGINAACVQSQRVLIHGRERVRGIIAPKLQNDGPQPKVDELLIDTGLSKSELEKLITPGDIITYDSDTSVLNGKVWVGRNFDNRIGSYCLVEAMRQVGETAVDVYAVSSVQEEVGLRGARPAAFAVAPDIGIAIDGSMARMAYVPEHMYLCEPGQGTGIYVNDNLTIGHPGLVRAMIDLCAERGIRCQRNIGGGTDAAAMQQSRSGVIATTIGAPVRYMHSTTQVCHADDMDATVDLLVAMMQTADKQYDKIVQPQRLPPLRVDPLRAHSADLADAPT